MAKRATVFGQPVEWYWHRFVGMPVKFPFCTSVWRGLYGFQFGSLFFGAIIGDVTIYKGKPVAQPGADKAHNGNQQKVR